MYRRTFICICVYLCVHARPWKRDGNIWHVIVSCKTLSSSHLRYTYFEYSNNQVTFSSARFMQAVTKQFSSDGSAWEQTILLYLLMLYINGTFSICTYFSRVFFFYQKLQNFIRVTFNKFIKFVVGSREFVTWISNPNYNFSLINIE